MSIQTQLTNAVAQTTDQTNNDIVFTDKFKNAVREYCEKDDQRLKLQTQLNKVRKEIKDLESDIMEFMENNHLPIFDTGEKGLFKSATKKKTGGINKKFLVESLGKCGQLKDPKKAEEVVNYIYDSRPTENIKALSRKT